jgi:predicted enzyme related to lactoylglutathione lyase
MISGPVHRDIPGRGHVIVRSFVDPNGVVLEVGQPDTRAPGQAGPISPILRASIAVAGDKIDPSIKFYQQVLGMSVLTDSIRTFEPGNLGLGMPDTIEIKIRLVVLQQGDSQIGNVGLLEYIEPQMEVKPFVKQPDSPYQVFFVFHIDDMEDVLARGSSVGSKILGRRQYKIPQRGKVDNATIIDPNGVAIDLIHWL